LNVGLEFAKYESVITSWGGRIEFPDVSRKYTPLPAALQDDS
jgi:hypothetical protein